MRLFAQIAVTALRFIPWVALWAAIPAAVLYPVVYWMLLHTRYPIDFLAKMYVLGVSVLFWPTAFGVDILYRKLTLSKREPN